MKFEKQINNHYYWNGAAGKLNDNCYYVMASVIRKSSNLKITKYINYNDKIALQPYYYENKEVQEALIPWKDWSSSHNLALTTKYIAKLTSNDLKIGKTTTFHLFSHSQICVLLSTSKFYTDDRDQTAVAKRLPDSRWAGT